MTKRSSERLEQLKSMFDRVRTENGGPYGLTLERAQKWILHFNVEHLHGPEEISCKLDELVVVCIVRDGRPYVKSFVEHYLSLGVKHMVFLDNGSTDGTIEALKYYNDVTVLQTTLPYKSYEFPMTQYLIERFGRGRWCLFSDIDELFDYPYSDVVSLSSLLRYLNERSYTAVVAQMLDMFPGEPLSEAASDEEEPLKEWYRFYDVSNIRRWSYDTSAAGARDHWAYRRGFYDTSEIWAQYYSAANTPNRRGNWASRKACGIGNVLANEEIEVYTHGIRNTVFGDSPMLTKHPLVFVDEKIKPKDLSSHSVSDARIADFTCVLFHYKFLKNHLYEWVRQVVREDRYWHEHSKQYKGWLEVLEKNPRLLVQGESASDLRSVNDLVENQFLVVSEEYMMLVYDEERKGAGRAPNRGEPSGTAEGEAAFYRARAQAKAQGLRARRLERRLEELREQNRREVEKLSRRLARAQQKNRSLTRQIQSVRASRIWRLLSKLGRLRVRVPGRKP